MGGLLPADGAGMTMSDYQPLAWADGNPNWRPSPMTPELAKQLRLDAELEDRGGDEGERRTCFTHQSWQQDCISDSSHANPMTGFNWCFEDWRPVQLCRCRPATVEG
jgi:hypothetical protein